MVEMNFNSDTDNNVVVLRINNYQNEKERHV